MSTENDGCVVFIRVMQGGLTRTMESQTPEMTGAVTNETPYRPFFIALEEGDCFLNQTHMDTSLGAQGSQTIITQSYPPNKPQPSTDPWFTGRPVCPYFQRLPI